MCLYTSSVSALGLFFVGWEAHQSSKQIALSVKQIDATYDQIKVDKQNTRDLIRIDNDRSRREKAVELMKYYTERFEVFGTSYLIRGMVSQLSRPECEKLIRGQSLVVSEQFAEIVDRFMLSQFGAAELIGKTDTKLQLTERQVTAISRATIYYLNILETIASAWRHHIADRDILADEFRTVFVRNNEFPLEEFRKVTGIFPSIKEFATHLINKTTPPPIESKAAL